MVLAGGPFKPRPADRLQAPGGPPLPSHGPFGAESWALRAEAQLQGLPSVISAAMSRAHGAWPCTAAGGPDHGDPLLLIPKDGRGLQASPHTVWKPEQRHMLLWDAVLRLQETEGEALAPGPGRWTIGLTMHYEVNTHWPWAAA